MKYNYRYFYIWSAHELDWWITPTQLVKIFKKHLSEYTRQNEVCVWKSKYRNHLAIAIFGLLKEKYTKLQKHLMNINQLVIQN